MERLFAEVSGIVVTKITSKRDSELTSTKISDAVADYSVNCEKVDTIFTTISREMIPITTINFAISDFASLGRLGRFFTQITNSPEQVSKLNFIGVFSKIGSSRHSETVVSISDKIVPELSSEVRVLITVFLSSKRTVWSITTLRDVKVRDFKSAT